MSKESRVPGRATAVVAGGSNSGAVTPAGAACLWGYSELEPSVWRRPIGRPPGTSFPRKTWDTRVAVSFGGQHAALLCVPADGGDAGGTRRAASEASSGRRAETENTEKRTREIDEIS